jgi:hypothetical protein
MIEKNKLRHLLLACKKEELPGLRRFVSSPYFNRQPELIGAMDYLSALWPDFDPDKMTKELIYQSAYPGQPFDAKQYRYLSSDLGRLIEQFWATERWQKSTRQPQIMAMAVASERGLEKTYQKINRALEHTLSANTATSTEQGLYERMIWSDNIEKHFGRTLERKYHNNVQNTNDYLDQYYFLEKLKLACIMEDRKSVIAGNYESRISEAWVSHLLANDCFGQPAIQLYYRVWLTLNDADNESYYHQLRDRLLTAIDQIELNYLRIVYQLVINYCARKIRQGKDEFIAEALHLYQRGLEQRILLNNGELSPWAFTNIVKLAMRLKRYDWGETFIHENAPLLPEAFRDNALHYNLAELFYYTHRRDEALQHLNQVAFSDLNYYLGARVMLSKIYYEQHDEEPLLSLMAAFIIFLKRNKEISATLKQTYLNYCEILLLLVKKQPRRLAGLDERINQTQPLTDRQWLLEQFQKIKF